MAVPIPELLPLTDSEKIHLKMIAMVPVDLGSAERIDQSIYNLEDLSSEILSDWRAHVNEKWNKLQPWTHSDEEFTMLNEWVGYCIWTVNQIGRRQTSNYETQNAMNALMFTTTDILFTSETASDLVKNFVRDSLEVVNTLMLRRYLEHQEDVG